MKYLIFLFVGLLNVLLFFLSISGNDKINKTKQIDWLDNPESNPSHEGDWEDVNGNSYKKNIDGNHYDSSGNKWNE
ncbi:hypothetical protein [Rheinheimera sp.]|uniref:hypothetical protein n=1 Tax=Rheinheimera sp. TaxID=1869214 RepID=UPI002FDE41AA